MLNRIPLAMWALLLPLAFPLVMRGEDPAPTADIKPTAPLSDAQVKELIQKLDAQKFGDRQSASQKLAEAGAAVIPALSEAAIDGTREMTVRSIDILKGHFQSSDAALKKSAEEALKKIADSQTPAAANRAKDALLPKPQPGANLPQFGNAGGIRVFGGNAQIQIQVQAIGGNGVKKISVKNNNGVKEIEAEENNRKIKINDDPNQGIKIEVTETKDGKETTRKVEAKDADDLKKKDAEAHKIYEQYSKGNGGIQINGIQIQGGGIQIQPGILPQPIPLQPGQFQLRPARLGGADLRKRLEDNVKRMEERLEKTKAEELPEELKKAQIESLERIIKTYKAQIERLPVEEVKPAEAKPIETKPEAKPAEVK